MIVLGVDPHKQSHTACALAQQTGELLGERTVRARAEGYEELLAFAKRLHRERLWAIEDSRHVSGRLERFLLARGEAVVRVPPKLMAEQRKGLREHGKSDAIDALAVARAALRERDLPVARLAGKEREIALLLDHREHLVEERTRLASRLRWLLLDLEGELELPAGALNRLCWLARIEEHLDGQRERTEARIAHELVARLRELRGRIRALEREITPLVRE